MLICVIAICSLFIEVSQYIFYALIFISLLLICASFKKRTKEENELINLSSKLLRDHEKVKRE